MLNSIIMFFIGLIFVFFVGYLAWDSYLEFKKHEPQKN